MESGASSNYTANDFSAAEKKELAKFLEDETQKAKLQMNVHNINDICWKKCITSKISSNKVESGESSCLKNCAERFVDSQLVIVKHLENIRDQL